MSEHGELDVLLIGGRAEPQQVKEPADEQERERAAHADDLGIFAEPLLKAQILRLHPSGIIITTNRSVSTLEAETS